MSALERHINLRISPELEERALRLIPSLEKSAEFQAAGKPTVSKVFRLAMMKGLDALEATHGVKPKGKQRRS